MISASKTTYNHCNLKILRPKVKKKILRIFVRSFVNSHPALIVKTDKLLVQKRLIGWRLKVSGHWLKDIRMCAKVLGR